MGCPTLCPDVKVPSVLLFIAEGSMEDFQLLTDKMLIVPRQCWQQLVNLACASRHTNDQTSIGWVVDIPMIRPQLAGWVAPCQYLGQHVSINAGFMTWSWLEHFQSQVGDRSDALQSADLLRHTNV